MKNADVYQLDTNVLLRYLTHDIPGKYQKVRLLFDLAKKGRMTLHICEPVFIETAVMLRNYFKFPKEKIISFLQDLLNASHLIIENSTQLASAVTVYSQYPIDLVDAVLLVRSQIHRRQIFTFDSKLALLASAQEKSN